MPTASKPPRPSASKPALAHSPGSPTNKGVHILRRAVRQVRAEGFIAFSVDLNGDNMKYASAPMREEIEAFLADERERPPDEQIVTLNGSCHLDELASRMARVDGCIVPSTWWEIFGSVISEAWTFGKPVICSNVGGPGRADGGRGGRVAFPVGRSSVAGARDAEGGE